MHVDKALLDKDLRQPADNCISSTDQTSASGARQSADWRRFSTDYRLPAGDHFRRRPTALPCRLSPVTCHQTAALPQFFHQHSPGENRHTYEHGGSEGCLRPQCSSLSSHVSLFKPAAQPSASLLDPKKVVTNLLFVLPSLPSSAIITVLTVDEHLG
jgi:hypothetical protein